MYAGLSPLNPFPHDWILLSYYIFRLSCWSSFLYVCVLVFIQTLIGFGIKMGVFSGQ